MVRSVAERAFVPARGLLEELGDMMILTWRTIWSALRPPYPVWRRARLAVPVRAAALLVSAARLHRLHLLRRARAAGRQLPDDLRRAGSPRRLLRARRRARDRAERDGDRRRRRGRHRDHRRPRRAQGARGARRAAGARRRPGQEPRRAALPGADGRDRACSTSTRCCSASSAASSPSSSTASRSARSGARCSPTPPPPTCGARC